MVACQQILTAFIRVCCDQFTVVGYFVASDDVAVFLFRLSTEYVMLFSDSHSAV